jgi:hypothetical protein
MSSNAPPPNLAALREFLVGNAMADQGIKTYPWYDAGWLRRYVAAKKVLARVRPDVLPEFVRTFDRLRTRLDFTVRKVDCTFDNQVMEKIRQTIRTLPPHLLENHEAEKFGRLVVHDHPFFTDLQRTLQPLVSELAGETIEPCYNFLSLYSQFGNCQPHLDAPEAKWTLDVCIDQTDIWPIHFSQTVPWPEDFSYQGDDWQTFVKQSPDLLFKSFSLQPNEAVLFSGSSQWHYRESLANVAKGGFCTLLFFHFLPEGMSQIVRPKNWPKIFGIPELAVAVGAPGWSRNL